MRKDVCGHAVSPPDFTLSVSPIVRIPHPSCLRLCSKTRPTATVPLAAVPPGSESPPSAGLNGPLRRPTTPTQHWTGRPRVSAVCPAGEGARPSALVPGEPEEAAAAESGAGVRCASVWLRTARPLLPLTRGSLTIVG